MNGVSAATSEAAPVSAPEAATLFSSLAPEAPLIVAVSGGPDSVALLALLAQWAGPERIALQAVTVDHGLRPEAAGEAHLVAGLCEGLGLPHRTRTWVGVKPRTGLQEKARAARYALLAEEARALGAAAIVTAHTLDDQAETLLMRMAAGSGLSGLAGMSGRAQTHGVALVRPLLGIAKARLVATCRAHGLAFVQDPSNADPRFTRVRWRALMPGLAGEGLSARRLGQLAGRLARADTALEARAAQLLAEARLPQEGEAHRLAFAALCREPEEMAIRVLALALDAALAADEALEAPPRLSRIEDCALALARAARERRGLRRTLGGFRLALAADGVLTLVREDERRRGVHPALE